MDRTLWGKSREEVSERQKLLRSEEARIDPSACRPALNEAPVGRAFDFDAAFHPYGSPGRELSHLLRIGGRPAPHIEMIPRGNAGDVCG